MRQLLITTTLLAVGLSMSYPGKSALEKVSENISQENDEEGETQQQLQESNVMDRLYDELDDRKAEDVKRKECKENGGKCCDNISSDTDCKRWKGKGWCLNNHAFYMLVACSKACFCDLYDPCVEKCGNPTYRYKGNALSGCRWGCQFLTREMKSLSECKASCQSRKENGLYWSYERVACEDTCGRGK